jgi:hypothetical protein
LENLKKLKSIDQNLQILEKFKDSILMDLETKKREMSSLIPEDLYQYPAKDNLEVSPRDQIKSKDSLKSLKKTKTFTREKQETKKKGLNQINQEVEPSKQDQKALFDQIREVYSEVLDVKNMSLIKKMSPLQMMTKIDSYFELLVMI